MLDLKVVKVVMMYKPQCTGSLQPRRYELLMDDFIKYLEKKGENPAASFVIFFLSHFSLCNTFYIHISLFSFYIFLGIFII